MTFVAGTVLTAAALNSELAAKTDTAMVQNAQTGTSYSYALADASKLLTMSNAASNTVLVTKQATVTWVTGTQLRILNLGAGVTTLVADTGVTINNNRALSQYQGGTLIRTASDVWTFQPNSSGKFLQVLSTTTVAAFTTNSSTFVDVTGLSVAITPASASNKILVTVTLALHNTVAGATSCANLLRNSTQIGGGTAVGSRPSGNVKTSYASAGNATNPISFTFLDSPASTASLTYKIQVRTEAGCTATVGYATGADTNSADNPRMAATITVTEVSA